MRRKLEHDRVSAVDLDKTDELPVLNVADYEAGLAVAEASFERAPPDPSEFTRHDVRSQSAAVGGEDALGDVDAWIAEQVARDRANQHALGQLRVAEAEASARAAQLASELETVRSGLQVALSRANESERALMDRGAAAATAEARARALAAELEETRTELRSTSERLSALETELGDTRQSLAGRVEAQARQELELAELNHVLVERGDRVTQLDMVLAAMRARVDESEARIAEHADAISRLATDNSRLLAERDGLERARRIAETRSTEYFERLRSREWQRGVWDGMWRDVDAELAEAQATIARNERQNEKDAAASAALLDDLAASHRAIEELKAAAEAQAEAMRALAEAREQAVRTLSEAREQDMRALSEAHERDMRILSEARAHEVRALENSAAELQGRIEELLQQIEALSDAARMTDKILAGREQELATARSATATLEAELRSLTSTAAAHVARIAELESVTINVGHALQAQTATAESAMAAAEASSKQVRAQQTKLADLEAALAALSGAAGERTRAAEAAQSALAEQQAELAVARERLAAFEQASGTQASRIDELERELARALKIAEQGDAPRRALELELSRVRSDLASQSERIAPLEARSLELALELEKARGILEERERQLRRLERQAAISAQVGGRIRSGLETGVRVSEPEVRERTPTGSAALVPLGGEGKAAIILSRRTTIGRAQDNDLCIENSTVSRHHALVISSSHGAFIVDMNSANGVRVNSRPVGQARLTEGDIVSLGEVQYRFTGRARSQSSSCP
jgi:chromosome segregation ATPase